MTVATNETLESVYGQVKRHEKSLAKVEHSGHRVERDVFGDLLAETRAVSHGLETVLKERQMDPEQIDVPDAPSTITPHSLINEINEIRESYGEAIAEFTTESSVKKALEAQHNRFSGGAQDKLEILCAAIVSDQ